MKQNYSKIISIVLSAAIISILVLSGPAYAFDLNLYADKTEVEQGKKIIFTASIDIESGENLPIDEIILILTHSDNIVECSFDITGKMKSGVNDACHGINIKKIPKPKIGYGYGYNQGSYGYGYGYNFGYGYGYTQQTLVYDITIHTQKFKIGTYETGLILVIGGREFSTQGPDITIKEKQKSKNKQEKITICHIPPGNHEQAHTITIGSPGVQAHLDHGDYLGECNKTNSSDNKLKKSRGGGGGGSSSSGGSESDSITGDIIQDPGNNDSEDEEQEGEGDGEDDKNNKNNNGNKGGEVEQEGEGSGEESKGSGEESKGGSEDKGAGNNGSGEESKGGSEDKGAGNNGSGEESKGSGSDDNDGKSNENSNSGGNKKENSNKGGNGGEKGKNK